MALTPWQHKPLYTPPYTPNYQYYGDDPASQRRSRMEEFERRMKMYPGAAPNGTGATGIAGNLGKTGLSDWDALQTQQKQYLDDLAAEKGQGPLPVRVNPGKVPSMQPQTHNAMRGLSSAIGGGSGLESHLSVFDLDQLAQAAKRRTIRDLHTRDPLSRAMGGRTLEGGLSHAREQGLLPMFDPNVERDVLNARGVQARRAQMSPLDLASEQDDIATRFFPRQLDRQKEMGYAQGDVDAYNYWQHEQPIEDYQHARELETIDRRGQYSTLDDQIRAATSLQVQGMRGQQAGAANQSAETRAAIAALQRMINNFTSLGDTAQAQRYQGILDQMIAGGGGGAPGGGAPGASAAGLPVGTRRMINGQLAEWDGQGWVAAGGG